MDKVLVVDDIAVNRKLISKIMRLQGYEVVEALDGKHAIKVFKEMQPDLILMDINMPVMDGYQAAARIKTMVDGGYMPIIFVTAMDEDTSLVEALAAGGDDFISKPLNAEILKSKVLAHLRIRELNRQLQDKNKTLSDQNRYLAQEQELAEYFFSSALQQSFLDPEYIKYHISPMSAFCGDVLLSERSPHGGLYVLLGDFTGHGLSAAMGTLPVAQVFFKMSRKGVGISDIASEINHQLVTLMPTGMFFAATLIEINASAERLSIWGGGLPEAYLINREGKLKQLIHSRHMPLGILDDQEFDSTLEVIEIEPGDKLFASTDGVTEAVCEDGELFGTDYLRSLLLDHGDDRFSRVVNTLSVLHGDKEQGDDTSFIKVSCKPLEAPTRATEDMQQLNGTLMPVHINVTLTADAIRNTDPVSRLSTMLETQPSLARNKGVIQALLSELYANALEHGLLGLESGKKSDEEHFAAYYSERASALAALEHGTIIIDLKFEPDDAGGSLHIRLTDSGAGFEVDAPGARDSELHGKGMGIVTALCEKVRYDDGGRTVEALYRPN